MKRFSSLTLATLAGLTLGPACSPKDPRIPSQPTAPPAPIVAPPTVVDATAPMGTAAAPTPTDSDASAPTEPDAAQPAADAAAAAAADAAPAEPVDLGNGPAETKAMLEEPDWGNAARLETWCARSIARATANRDLFKKGEVPTGLALDALNNILLELDTVEGYASLHFNVNPSKEVRDVATKCKTDLSKFGSDLSLDRSVYEAMAKVDATTLDPISRHNLEKTLRDFIKAGVDKDEATRARISEINNALTELGQEYQKTVNADTRSVTFTDEAMLDGLPDDWKASHPKNDKGEIIVTTDYPDLLPFLTYAKNADARKQLAAASGSRGYPTNAENLKKTLALRAELAKLVGFPSFAALDLSDKMAGTVETAESFIKDASEAGKPRLEKDLAILLARMKKDDPNATAVTVADRLYLINRVRAEQFNFDSKSVREFFPYAKVKDGIFAVYGELFGVEFTRLPDAPTWHPSVEAWEMRQGGELIGRFFLDNHPRADKYKHAAMFPIQVGTEARTYTVKSGDTDMAVETAARIPWASLVCNFPNPADGDALMEHDDVVTFFHEFGHLIHHLLARKGPWVATSGINVEWDFVEAPSQLLEEWAWDAKVLARFAKNADGKAIPAKAIAAMRAAEEFGKGVDLARQLFYAAYSFYVHTADTETLDLEAFTDDLYSRWSPYPRPEGDRLYANFAHLIGYKSAYYTYQWSLAIAKDLFGRFKAKGLMDKATAADYREKVLVPGGTKKADALVEDFLGRPRNLDAYRAWIAK